jgi:hypothetical protein
MKFLDYEFNSTSCHENIDDFNIVAETDVLSHWSLD